MDVSCGSEGGLETLASGCHASMSVSGVDGIGSGVKRGRCRAPGCIESDDFCAVVGVVGVGVIRRGGRTRGAGGWVEECSDGCHMGEVAM